MTSEGFRRLSRAHICNAPINYYLHCVCVAACYNNKMEVCGDGARRTDTQNNAAFDRAAHRL